LWTKTRRIRTKNFLGLDPGQSGGLALIAPDGQIVKAIKMPETEKEIYEAIASVWTEVEFAYIEQVASRPGQGVASMFKFGMGYGGLRMALVACRIPFEAIRPQVWQSRMGVPPRGNKTKTEHKNELKGMAQRLWPDASITLATCDALVLAEYNRRWHLGLL
jgi:crossover junction endodeoxyribonuclease RuvC